MEESLIQTLLKLVKIDGPSRFERDVADHLTSELSGLGCRVIEDETAKIVNGNSGNLLCFPPHFNPERPALLLVAHMDTVNSTREMVPVVRDGKIMSANDFALGVDNRAGVTILLNGVRNLIQRQSKANVVFAFTVCEEVDPAAARALAVPGNVKMAYIFDSSARPGTFIGSTFGAKAFRFQIIGKSAHAGVEPEKGINAISLASQVISDIPVGRISPDLTCNIAFISGGGAINVVPDHVEVKGETRGTYQNELENLLRKIEEKIREICQQNRADFEFTSKQMFSPYRIAEDSPAFKLLAHVLNSLDLQPNPIHYSGGSDANVFNEKGLLTINVGIGAQHPHATDEFILVEDLLMSYNIVIRLIEEFEKQAQ